MSEKSLCVFGQGSHASLVCLMGLECDDWFQVVEMEQDREAYRQVLGGRGSVLSFVFGCLLNLGWGCAKSKAPGLVRRTAASNQLPSRAEK